MDAKIGILQISISGQLGRGGGRGGDGFGAYQQNVDVTITSPHQNFGEVT